MPPPALGPRTRPTLARATFEKPLNFHPPAATSTASSRSTSPHAREVGTTRPFRLVHEAARGWSSGVEPNRTLWRRTCSLVVIATFAGSAAAADAARPQVAALQVALRARGLYAGPIDAVYGPASSRSLRRSQRRVGLHVDGRAGPATRRALGPLGRPGLGTRTLRRGALGWDVSVVQFLLAERGAVLPINGFFGVRTEHALRRFQRTHGLVADGIAGRRSLGALLAHPADHVAGRVRETPPTRVRELIDYWAGYYGVDRRLVRALAWMESGFQANLTSPVGAWGVMQILPVTWIYVETILIGRTVPRTTSGNIRVGVVLIRQLLHEFRDPRAALAAWYQGPASLRKRGALPETKLFVANVIALRDRSA